MPILACQALFGLERGTQIKELVETTTGLACPCIRGLTCPLLGPQASVAEVASPLVG